MRVFLSVFFAALLFASTACAQDIYKTELGDYLSKAKHESQRKEMLDAYVKKLEDEYNRLGTEVEKMLSKNLEWKEQFSKFHKSYFNFLVESSNFVDDVQWWDLETGKFDGGTMAGTIAPMQIANGLWKQILFYKKILKEGTLIDMDPTFPLLKKIGGKP